MGRETLGEVRDRSETLAEVRHGWGDPWKSPGLVEGPSKSSGTGRGNLGRSVTGDRRRGPGRVGGPSWRFETGRGTLWEVRDRWEDTQEGP